MSIAIPKRGNGAAAGVPKFQISPEQKQYLSDYIRAKRVANKALAILEEIKGPALAIVQLAGGSYAMNRALLRESMSVSYAYSSALTRRKLALRNEERIEQLNGKAEKIERPCLVMSEVQAAA